MVLNQRLDGATRAAQTRPRDINDSSISTLIQTVQSRARRYIYYPLRSPPILNS
jgi:hypothetical protein